MIDCSQIERSKLVLMLQEQDLLIKDKEEIIAKLTAANLLLDLGAYISS